MNNKDNSEKKNYNQDDKNKNKGICNDANRNNLKNQGERTLESAMAARQTNITGGRQMIEKQEKFFHPTQVSAAILQAKTLSVTKNL